MNKFITENIKTPVKYECDVCVCGGGFAGISAALYAARGNMNPLLINNGIGALEKAEAIENGVDIILGSHPHVLQKMERYEVKTESGEEKEAFVIYSLGNFISGQNKEKRKQSNQRLISRKAMIGKVLGFSPMVCLFVGYLIVPLVVIGLGSMTSAFSGMQTSI